MSVICSLRLTHGSSSPVLVRECGLTESPVGNTDIAGLFRQHVRGDPDQVAVVGIYPPEGLFPSDIQYQLVQRAHGQPLPRELQWFGECCASLRRCRCGLYRSSYLKDYLSSIVGAAESTV